MYLNIVLENHLGPKLLIVQDVQNVDVNPRQITSFFKLCSEPFLMLGNLCIPVGLTRTEESGRKKSLKFSFL